MHVCGCVVILWFSTFRRIVVDESRVMAAVWGPFDQFLKMELSHIITS